MRMFLQEAEFREWLGTWYTIRQPPRCTRRKGVTVKGLGNAAALESHLTRSVEFES